MKKVIYLLLISLIIITGCKEKKKEVKKEEIKVNQSLTLEKQVVNGLSFDDFIISTDSDNITHLYVDVTNKTEDDINVNNIKCELYSKDELIMTVNFNVNNVIEALDTISLSKDYDTSLKNIDSVKYILE